MPPEVTITIRGDDSSAAQVLERLNTNLQNVNQSAERTSQSVAGSSTSFTQMAAAVAAGTTAASAFHAAVGYIEQGVAKLTRAINRGDDFNALSQRMGLAAQTASQLALAAQTSNSSIEVLAVGMRTLSMETQRAAEGQAQAVTLFSKLGISVRETSGELKSNKQILLESADALSKMQDGSAKSAAAMQLLGRAGSQLIPLWNEGAAGLQRWMDISDRIGSTISNQTAKQFDIFNDALIVANSAIDGVINQISSGMAPALADAGNALIELVSQLGIGDGTLREFGAQIGLTIAQVSAAMRNLTAEMTALGPGATFADKLKLAMGDVSSVAHDIGKDIGTALWHGAIDVAAQLWRNVDWAEVISFAIFGAIGGIKGVGLAFIGHAIMEGISGGAVDKAKPAADQIVSALGAELQRQAQAQAPQQSSKFWEAMLGIGVGAAGAAIGNLASGAATSATAKGLVAALWETVHNAMLEAAAHPAVGISAAAALLIAAAFATVKATDVAGSRDLENRLSDAWADVAKGALSSASEKIKNLQQDVKLNLQWGADLGNFPERLDTLAISFSEVSNIMHTFGDSSNLAAREFKEMAEEQMSVDQQCIETGGDFRILGAAVTQAGDALNTAGDSMAAFVGKLRNASDELRAVTGLMDVVASQKIGTPERGQAEQDVAVYKELLASTGDVQKAFAAMAAGGDLYYAALEKVRQGTHQAATQFVLDTQNETAAEGEHVTAMKEAATVYGAHGAAQQAVAKALEQESAWLRTHTGATREEIAAIQQATAGKIAAAMASAGYSASIKTETDNAKSEIETVKAQIASQEAYIKTFNDRIAAGDKVAVAEKAASEAAKAASEGAKLHATATAEERAELEALTQAEQKLAAQRQSEVAIAKYKEDTQQMQDQINLIRQMIDDGYTRVQIEHEIAVQMEMQRLAAGGAQGDLRALAEAHVTVAENLKKVTDEYQHLGTAANSLGQSLKSAFDQSFDAVIAGTRNLGDIWKGFALGLGKDFLSGLLFGKNQFDDIFKHNITDLGGMVQDLFGFITGGSGGTGSSSSLFGIGGSRGGTGSSGNILDSVANWVVNKIGSWFGGSGGSGLAEDYLSQQMQMLGFPAEQANQFAGVSSSFSVMPYVQGAMGGFEGTQLGQSLFWSKNPTGLTGIAARGAVPGILGNARIIDSTIGSILGAVFGGMTGTGAMGGGIMGLISSLAGAGVLSSIDRSTLLGKGWKSGSFVDTIRWLDPITNVPFSDMIMSLLGIPTLGTALRRGGESILDESKTFSGLQAKFGDWTRSEGGPYSLTRNYITGPQIAMSRGMTAEQVATIAGSTEAIFSYLGKNEKFPQDAGSLALDQGRIMAEFLSRGLVEGLSFDELFSSLRSFAQEAGITLQSALGNMPKLFEQMKAQATDFQKLDPMKATKFAADEYGKSIYGIIQTFKVDYPVGTQIATVALQNMQKDGVHYLDTLSQKQKDALAAMSPDQQRQVFSTLAEQGYSIDMESFNKQLTAVAASTDLVGKGLATALTSDDVQKGLVDLGASIQKTIQGQAATAISQQVMEKTGIGSSFEGAFAQIDKLKDLNILDPAALQAWGGDFSAALADGQARLMEYLPLLQQIQDAMEAAFNADTPEMAAMRIKQYAEQAKADLTDLTKQLYNQGVTTGNTSGISQAFYTQAQANVQAARSASVAKGFVESEAGKRLAQELAEYQEAMRKAAGDPALMAAADKLGQKYLEDARAYGAELQKQTEQAAIASGAKLQQNMDTVKASLQNAITAALSALDSGSAADAGKALAEGIGGAIREQLQQELIANLIDQVVIQAQVAPLMLQFQQASMAGASPEALAAIAAQMAAVVKSGVSALMPSIQAIHDALDPLSAKNLDKLDASTSHIKVVNGDIVRVGEDAVNSGRKAISAAGDATDASTHATRTVTQATTDLATETDKVTTSMGNLGSAIQGIVGAINDTLVSLGRQPIGTGGSGGGGTGGGSGSRVHLGGSGGTGPVTRGAARGGFFSGSAVVGEGGYPELVTHHAGGFSVVPLSWSAASAMLGSGMRGFAQGTPRDPRDPYYGETPVDPRPGRIPIGPPHGPGELDPFGGGGGEPGHGGPGDPGRHHTPPGLGGGGGGQVPGRGRAPSFAMGEYEVGLDISSAFKDLAKSGDMSKFSDALKQAANEAVFNGVIDGLLKSGPVQKAIDEFNAKMKSATANALKDGVISPEEEAALAQLGKDQADKVKSAVAGVKPAMDALARVFGTDLGSQVSENITSGMNSAIETFAKGGSAKDMRTSLRESAYEGILSGMIDALLQGDAIKEAKEQLSDAMSSAMEDGIISPEEAAAIGQLGRHVAAEVSHAATAAGPAFDALARAFGINASHAMDQVKSALSGAVATAFGRDPEKFGNFAEFVKGVRQSLYEHIRDGLVDAFMQSAVFGGALAPMLAAISSIFDRLVAKEMTVVEANAAIAAQIALINGVLNDPAFQAAFNTMISSVSQVAAGLGTTTTDAEEAADTMKDTAEAVQDSIEVYYLAARARLPLATLGDMGRAGEVSIIYYEPRLPEMAAGGVVTRRQKIVAGEKGPEAIVPLDQWVRGSGGGSYGGSDAVDKLAKRVDDMAQQHADALSELGAQLAYFADTISNRPLKVQIGDREIADVVVDRLERTTRGGKRPLARVGR